MQILIFTVDKSVFPWYYVQASSDASKYARVVELVDSLDSGSSAHSGHAGSSPASRTIRDSRKAVSFFVRLGSPKGLKPLCFQGIWQYRGIFCFFLVCPSLLQLFMPVFVDLVGGRATDDKTLLLLSNVLLQLYTINGMIITTVYMGSLQKYT